MSLLFTPLALREVTLRNRIAVSPMCQYSSQDGLANEWHAVHLGSRAVGGAGLVLTEAAAVEPRGRISPQDLGLWNDAQIEPLARINRFVTEQGATVGIQLAHAGRKASTQRPWEGRGPVSVDEGGWIPIGPSATAFADGFPVPEALDEAEIPQVVRWFVDATRRSLEAGFQVVEIHAAHGYLLHEFLSPLANFRTDRYGGSFDNRIRLLREVVEAVRGVWPDRLPLLVRISATDWTDGGWDLEQSVELARHLRAAGVDLIDCSSGGIIANGGPIPVGPGYQTTLAERIGREAGIPTGAVGLITSAEQAEHILRTGQADLAFIARELLRDPYWPLRAAKRLGASITWPAQYERARD